MISIGGVYEAPLASTFAARSQRPRRQAHHVPRPVVHIERVGVADKARKAGDVLEFIVWSHGKSRRVVNVTLESSR